MLKSRLFPRKTGTRNQNNAEALKVIIPDYNEEDSIAKVIAEIPEIVKEVIVVNNSSINITKTNVSNTGGTVLQENRMAYGFAFLKEWIIQHRRIYKF
ncbi:hypothetical protein [Gramella sp. AN32]|uniref:Glycosyltransferase 2-like domain-containing protein n=1 Tax=Christiangramia antarctica TaxID=2058158 RepID=A0ABW5X0A1_9FLAO|nr:hypothetical protein [Gramella sp. AN32]MCM4157958.1 hypothetical protein [Gramella sp. AN32]